MIDASNMTVLIVDVDKNMTRSVRGMLKILQFGKGSFLAHNGLEAWKILKEEKIDLMILEWKIPVLSGVELLDRIREDKDLRYMPVIMISNDSNKGIVAEAGESEIDAFLVKPITAIELEEKIAMVLKKANSPSKVTQLLRKSKETAEEGKTELSFKLVNAAVQAAPNSSRPIRELGVLLFNTKEIDSAEKCFIKAIKFNPMDVVALHYLGEIYLLKKQHATAEKFYQKAMDISPRHVSSVVEFGKALVRDNKSIKAGKIFNAAIEQSNNSYVLIEEIAEFCFDKGLNIFALKQYDFLLSRLPRRSDIMKKIGILRRKEGDHKIALNMLKKAEIYAKDDVEIKLEIADVLIILKQPFMADEILRTILKTDPENTRASDLIAMCV